MNGSAFLYRYRALRAVAAQKQATIIMASNPLQKCSMDISKVFADFIFSLNKRQDKKHMTEDNVRYYWFDSMRLQDRDLNKYTLESPYPEESSPIQHPNQKELDLLYNDGEMCFEIKFHRKGKSAYAHTDAAGAIFNDLKRLEAYTKDGINSRRLFLYVTDDEMGDYFRNRSKQCNHYREELKKFYYMEPGNQAKFSFSSSEADKDVPKTFWKSSFSSFKQPKKNEILQVTVKLLQRDDSIQVEMEDKPLANSQSKQQFWHVRLYEVL